MGMTDEHIVTANGAKHTLHEFITMMTDELIALHGYPPGERMDLISDYVLRVMPDCTFHVFTRIRQEWAKRAVQVKRAEAKKRQAHYAANPAFGMFG